MVDKLLASLSEEDIDAVMDELQVFITGTGTIYCPLPSFVEAGLPSAMTSAISSAGFEKPTPIQVSVLNEIHLLCLFLDTYCI